VIAALSEGQRAIGLVGAGLLVMLAWLTARTLRMAATSPERLVGELRLAQVGASVLGFVAAGYLGLAAARPGLVGTGLVVTLALGFLVVAITAPLKDPHDALSLVALAFLAHAALDVLYRPGLLPDALPPRWYVLGCAIHNVLSAALCYLPVWWRR
jgi:hypothetical protein